ncbi:hypothetical protein OUZ56_030999 [Daphnia magna]|uniref:Uncharacterized protein n=1 Tax=Daphnia magna TaxID=35525 RepID=A0ABQ9ZSZ0_9CRUS|nr:hypothetical protein OUZ56_030999 [Daphnia magna]
MSALCLAEPDGYQLALGPDLLQPIAPHDPTRKKADRARLVRLNHQKFAPLSAIRSISKINHSYITKFIFAPNPQPIATSNKEEFKEYEAEETEPTDRDPTNVYHYY